MSGLGEVIKSLSRPRYPVASPVGESAGRVFSCSMDEIFGAKFTTMYKLSHGDYWCDGM